MRKTIDQLQKEINILRNANNGIPGLQNDLQVSRDRVKWLEQQITKLNANQIPPQCVIITSDGSGVPVVKIKEMQQRRALFYLELAVAHHREHIRMI